MSFQQAISGLNATARNIDVIGNNIANANTIGAKVSRAEFADMFSSAVAGSGGKQAGVGVAVAAVSQMFHQGSITSTNNPLDMAINGNGFFQVKTAGDAVNYTRNGQFKFDQAGFIVNNQGNKLIGYPVDAAGVVAGGEAGILQLTELSIAPKATTRISVAGNLDSRATQVDLALPFDPQNASTYNFTTSVTAVDANGKEIAVTAYFRKINAETDPGSWEVYATSNGELANAGAGLVTTISFGGTTGGEIDPASAVATMTLPTQSIVMAADGSQTTTMEVDLDLLGFSQIASASAVTGIEKDGYVAGDLVGVYVTNDGTVKANFSNGKNRAIGQIELVTFRNPSGLRPLGGNEWALTDSAGAPIPGTAGTGSLGSLQTSALEESNVDLTSELVQMMIAQRVYQANAQTIKTQDQVLQTLVNMR